MRHIEDYFYKVVRKLHIQEAVYRAAAPFVQSIITMDTNVARKQLEAFSPNKGGSALRDNQILPPEWDLTIIIPAYNVEAYVETCINSVLEQITQYSYRIIVVNDGSTDSTEQILEHFRDHPAVTLISQENGGAARARNRALETIRSAYVMFVDADDVLEPGAIESLMSKAIEQDADIVEGGYYTFLNPSSKRYFPVSAPGCYEDPYGVITGFTCMKVLKSALFHYVAFPEGYWFEDTLIAMLVFPQVCRVVQVDDIVYGYRINVQGSTARARLSPKSLDSLWVTEQMMIDLTSLNQPMTEQIYKQLLLQCIISVERACGLPEEIRKALFIQLCEMAEHYDQDFKLGDPWFSRLKDALMMRDYGRCCMLCRLIL